MKRKKKDKDTIEDTIGIDFRDKEVVSTNNTTEILNIQILQQLFISKN